MTAVTREGLMMYPLAALIDYPIIPPTLLLIYLPRSTYISIFDWSIPCRGSKISNLIAKLIPKNPILGRLNPFLESNLNKTVSDPRDPPSTRP